MDKDEMAVARAILAPLVEAMDRHTAATHRVADAIEGLAQVYAEANLAEEGDLGEAMGGASLSDVG